VAISSRSRTRAVSPIGSSVTLERDKPCALCAARAVFVVWGSVALLADLIVLEEERSKTTRGLAQLGRLSSTGVANS
jgi:hypothetical protein